MNLSPWRWIEKTDVSARKEVTRMPRIALGEEQKKMYKILDFKGWVAKQMKLAGKNQTEVAEALGISPGRMSQMLKIPETKDRNKKKKGEKLEMDVFSYGQVLTLCEFFGVDGEEKERLLTL